MKKVSVLCYPGLPIWAIDSLYPDLFQIWIFGEAYQTVARFVNAAAPGNNTRGRHPTNTMNTFESEILRTVKGIS